MPLADASEIVEAGEKRIDNLGVEVRASARLDDRNGSARLNAGR